MFVTLPAKQETRRRAVEDSLDREDVTAQASLCWLPGRSQGVSNAKGLET